MVPNPMPPDKTKPGDDEELGQFHSSHAPPHGPTPWPPLGAYAPYVTSLPPVEVADATANPAPLGLCAFGMTTILLNLHNAGLFVIDGMILGMGCFYGGAAQIVAGVFEMKKGNTFAATAFLSYGFFWLCLCVVVGAPSTWHPSRASMAAWFIVWGLFTAVLFVGTLRLTTALQVVFASLTLLFALLALGEITGIGAFFVVAGVEGIACGAAAAYTGLAQVLNEVFGRTVCPIDRPVAASIRRARAAAHDKKPAARSTNGARDHVEITSLFAGDKSPDEPTRPRRVDPSTRAASEPLPHAADDAA